MLLDFLFVRNGKMFNSACPWLIWVKVATKSFYFQWPLDYSWTPIFLFLSCRGWVFSTKQKGDRCCFSFKWQGRWAFCKGRKQVKLKQVDGQIAGLKDRQVAWDLRKMGLVPDWAAQVGSRAEGVRWDASTDIHLASLQSVMLLSACLQRGTVCLVPAE